MLTNLGPIHRKEGYILLTASSGVEGLKILKENDVHLVLSDQRMPQMSGTEFLAEVKEKYPDVIRIILTGYTEIDSITESINKGNIYKFFLKPWNDQNLKLEITKALEQYDLIQSNKRLHEKVLKQNEELKRINENLERLIQEKTEELEIQKMKGESSKVKD
ncbi:MAG: response regulator [Deltaproteobacteria bacterium]|nr:response regulator [Deltaproteobacteria bacterium]